MNEEQIALYRSGLSLAKQLGRPVEEVPKPFQLNELEDYIVAAKAELEARPKGKSNGPAGQR